MLTLYHNGSFGGGNKVGDERLIGDELESKCFSIKKRNGPYKKPQIIPKVYGPAKYGPLDF
jgi:hypothetical protein